MISKFLSSYCITLFCMGVLDALWLSSTMNILYKKNIGHLMGTSPSYFPALIFYLLYAFGITIFIVLPGIQQQKSFNSIFLFGALFGLIAYGTYDLTNHATLYNWPLVITIVDMLWGTTVTGISSCLSVYLLRMLGVA